MFPLNVCGRVPVTRIHLHHFELCNLISEVSQTDCLDMIVLYRIHFLMSASVSRLV